MILKKLIRLVPLVMLGFGALEAQEKKPEEPARQRPRIVSPDLQPDRSVIFRLAAPQAKSVKVSISLGAGTHDLARDADGLWSANVGPLAPELYHYSFLVDGARLPDPSISYYQVSGGPGRSLLEVPGDPPLLQQWRDVPHGEVRLREFWSKAANSLRHVVVATPPGYNQATDQRYPVLYLLHGAGDRELAWTADGRAHYILDNLIAEKKARPMIIVMPDGHRVPAGQPAAFGEALPLFEKGLLEDLIPYIEQNFRVIPDAAHRAMAGLSMGGFQSSQIGLNHQDQFAWLGFFSGVTTEDSVKPALEDAEGTNRRLKLIWLGVGRDDELTLVKTQAMHEAMKQRGIKHEFHLTEGRHEWNVWRKYLAEFLPKIF